MSYPPKEYYEEDARKLRQIWISVGCIVRFPCAALIMPFMLIVSLFSVDVLDDISDVWEWAVNGGDVKI